MKKSACTVQKKSHKKVLKRYYYGVFLEVTCLKCKSFLKNGISTNQKWGLFQNSTKKRQIVNVSSLFFLKKIKKIFLFLKTIRIFILFLVQIIPQNRQI
jgi:hypothetical protein